MVAYPRDDTANSDVTSLAAEPLPDDIETLKAMLLAERQAYRAELRDQALLIEKLKHRIAKLQHERFGQSSERRAPLGPLQLPLFELGGGQAPAGDTEESATPPT